MNKISPINAQTGDYIVRFSDGKAGRPERIVSIHAKGISIKGHEYACGYSDYFGDAPKSSMSFGASQEYDGNSCRVEVFRDTN